jgi:hypothetical protein
MDNASQSVGFFQYRVIFLATALASLAGCGPPPPATTQSANSMPSKVPSSPAAPAPRQKVENPEVLKNILAELMLRHPIDSFSLADPVRTQSVRFTVSLVGKPDELISYVYALETGDAAIRLENLSLAAPRPGLASLSASVVLIVNDPEAMNRRYPQMTQCLRDLTVMFPRETNSAWVTSISRLSQKNAWVATGECAERSAARELAESMNNHPRFDKPSLAISDWQGGKFTFTLSFLYDPEK